MQNYTQEPELKEFFRNQLKTLSEIETRDGKSPLLNEGLNFKAWVENPDSAPSEDYLARAPISVPGIFMTQIANYVLVSKKGYPTADLIKATGAVSGHSQGVIASALVGLGKDGQDFLKAYSDFLKFVFYLGFCGQKVFPNFTVSQDIVSENEANGDKNPSPMAAVIGYTKDELEDRVKQTNESLGLKGQDTVYISLYNTPDSMILSALPSSLLAFRKKWKLKWMRRNANSYILKQQHHSTARLWNPRLQNLKQKMLLLFHSLTAVVILRSLCTVSMMVTIYKKMVTFETFYLKWF